MAAHHSALQQQQHDMMSQLSMQSMHAESLLQEMMNGPDMQVQDMEHLLTVAPQYYNDPQGLYSNMDDVQYMHTRHDHNMQDEDGCITPPAAQPASEAVPSTEGSKRSATRKDGAAAPAKKKKVRHVLLEGQTSRPPGGAPMGANRRRMTWNYWTGLWEETGAPTELQAARAKYRHAE